ncbi:DUF2304 domain-containing protein [Candidatus Dojkabacteria bacterium]|uniref:DUF2304 domain-containing protein n=1 Tax=Candidatus Dojkabacteria bacterium TaxID=2099670 RepID=A0A847CYN6_9BACT|nr:DUF2304 domain-containing protein [Candidatus Dojkabacteria bacterium]
MIIQYIVTGIIAVILVQLIVRVIKDRTQFFKLLFWGLFWGVSLIFIWLPTNTIDKLGQLFGVGRGIDVLVYLSVVFLFYYIFRQNEKVGKLEKQITKLVRELAKQNAKS